MDRQLAKQDWEKHTKTECKKPECGRRALQWRKPTRKLWSLSSSGCLPFGSFESNLC